ncbi:MAG: hypothetical protein JW795_09375 [Chitinivibrionales bacterium]|nr:hypothetical protein [Chitinivibrionales bacterium]
MNHRIFRSYKESLRENISYEVRWKSCDKGLINCWEVGRELSKKDPELAERARNGELPALGWKGGVKKKTKKKKSTGLFIT